MTDQGAPKPRWQQRTLGLLVPLFCCGNRPKRLQLGVDNLNIPIEQIAEQVFLLGADLLAALGKPVLLDDGMIGEDLSAHGVDLRQTATAKRTRATGREASVRGLVRKSCFGFYQKRSLVVAGRGANYSF